MKLARGIAVAAALVLAPAATWADATVRAAADRAWAHPGSGTARALIVHQAGRTTYERYADGFDASTRFASWSMAKTVTALAVGMLVADGKLTLDAPAPVDAWRGDARSEITLRHLLFMTSGLDHREGNEGGAPIHTADTVRMLFVDGSRATADYAIARPLAQRPGTFWKYSTGTTQILAAIVSATITSEVDADRRRRAVAGWFQTRLFTPLGLRSAEWDFDANGIFLGSSLIHMTAQDYLRLGTFLLGGGVGADGRQIVPRAWLELMTSRSEGANNSHYGGHVWLNSEPASGQNNNLFHPRGGVGTYGLVGHLGQYVVVVPAKRAVIVRLGKSTTPERRPLREALGLLIDSLPDSR